ncbi:hypothetical protein KIW84_011080 [Lathyrus oleraceus]|uniref:Uncharacterized protein n=1 Tax=Pisum sativum TaxID=3888 RepID=A0A9D4YLS4_PEA|nr:hypothetical protein KIW84_011080 [Pisum sativum]
MVVRDDSLIPYFYLHLPVIYYLGVLIPFRIFEDELLTTTNVAPSEITSNVWSIIRAFKIQCRMLDVFPTVRLFFSFYSVQQNPTSGWVTLFSLLGKKFLAPHSNPYLDWKDKFVRFKGDMVLRQMMLEWWKITMPGFQMPKGWSLAPGVFCCEWWYDAARLFMTGDAEGPSQGWMLSFRPNAKGQAFVGKRQVRFWLPSKVGGCLFYCVDDRKIPKARILLDHALLLLLLLPVPTNVPCCYCQSLFYAADRFLKCLSLDSVCIGPFFNCTAGFDNAFSNEASFSFALAKWFLSCCSKGQKIHLRSAAWYGGMVSCYSFYCWLSAGSLYFGSFDDLFCPKWPRMHFYNMVYAAVSLFK